MNIRRSEKQRERGAVYVELSVLLPALAFIGLGFFDLISSMNKERSLVDYAQQIVAMEQLPVMMAFSSLNADKQGGVDSGDEEMLRSQFHNAIGITGLPKWGENPWRSFMENISIAVGRSAPQSLLLLMSLDYVPIDGDTGAVRGDGRLIHAGSLSFDGDANIYEHAFGSHGCDRDSEKAALRTRVGEVEVVAKEFGSGEGDAVKPPGIFWYSVKRTGASGETTIQQYLPYVPILTVRLCSRPYNVLLGQQSTFQFSMIPKKLMGFSRSTERQHESAPVDS